MLSTTAAFALSAGAAAQPAVAAGTGTLQATPSAAVVGSSSAVVVSDTFGRSVAGGLGAAELGGPWTVVGPAASYGVSAGAARVALGAASAGRDLALKNVLSRDTEMTLGVALAHPQTGGGTYVYVVGRRSSAGEYRLKVHYSSDGSLTASLQKYVGGVESPLLTSSIPRLAYLPGTAVRVRLRVSGTFPTTVSAKVWRAGVAEPAGWQLKANDSQAALQVAGSVGITSYRSRSSLTASETMAVTDLHAVAAQTRIMSGPAAGSSTSSTSAAFGYVSSRPDSTYQCQLDGAAWTGCASTAGYNGLAAGAHSFSVRGLDADGHIATTALRTWTVTQSTTTTVRPGGGNTGVPVGTHLTPHYGTLTLNTPGAHYDSLDIHGFVWVKAPNVTISRSIIRGGYGTAGVDQGLVTNYSATATNFLIEDSELVPEHPSVSLDAIKGANFTARRVNMHGTVDGAKIHGDNVRVEASWLHDFVTYASDPYQHGGPSHNDGVQILGGNNIAVVGNTIYGASNTAVLVTQDFRAATNVAIMRNWLDGGNQTMAAMAKPLPTLTGVTVRDNGFGRHTRYYDCAILYWPGVTLAASGNVWDATGLPVRIHVP